MSAGGKEIKRITFAEVNSYCLSEMEKRETEQCEEGKELRALRSYTCIMQLA
jgi:hypothetical protein